jgi:hypothetical protein
MCLNTQQDPIGIAGGLNHYGYAGGDPINYSDPFGLCKDEDEVCKELVRMLQSVGDEAGEAGAIFHGAATALKLWKGGSVQLITSEEPPLGPSTDVSRAFGLAPTSPSNPTGDLYLATDQDDGDFVMTTVHEVLHLPFMMGLGHPAKFRDRCRSAYDALPGRLKSQAPGHARAGNRIGC